MNRNITMNLPESLIDKLRVYAARQKQSMTAVVKEAIEKTVIDDSSARKAATRRLIERMKNAKDIGLHGKIPYTRDQMHER